MMASHEEQIPTELMGKWANYLPPSRAVLFRKSCIEASMQSLGTALRPFFATWKTSLMRSSLETLKSISNDDHIRTLIEVLIIEDDTSRLDPHSSSELPSLQKAYNIWSWNSAGLIITSGGDIAISDLIAMLYEKKFPRLFSLKIRDYAISPMNFRVCDEMLYAKDLLPIHNKDKRGSAAVASFARDILESAAAAADVYTDLLLITYLEIQHANILPVAEDSVLRSPRFRESTESVVVCGPVIHEAVLDLTFFHNGSQPAIPTPPAEKQQQKLTQQFSLLRAANVRLAGADNATTIYWLENVFSSPSLRTLDLSFTNPLSLAARRANRVEATPCLKGFILRNTTTSAQEILALISSSKATLVDLTFRHVTLLDDRCSTWDSLLSFIAKDFRALTSFHLASLREEARGSFAINFLNRVIGREQLTEYEEGLSASEKGPESNRRVTTVGYRGMDAGFVLGVLAKDERV